jgi:hypothetical protein
MDMPGPSIAALLFAMSKMLMIEDPELPPPDPDPDYPSPGPGPDEPEPNEDVPGTNPSPVWQF